MRRSILAAHIIGGTSAFRCSLMIKNQKTWLCDRRRRAARPLPLVAAKRRRRRYCSDDRGLARAIKHSARFCCSVVVQYPSAKRSPRGLVNGKSIICGDLSCAPGAIGDPEELMTINVSEFVWKRLGEWGLNRVYGYPGDGVGGLDVALEKAKDEMEYVQVRHEEMAAFMASAHAKFTGQPGLCYATSGPGAIHLLNGLYDAKMDHVPVVAIVGQQARIGLGAHYQQEVDLQSLFKAVAADYVAAASGRYSQCREKGCDAGRRRRSRGDGRGYSGGGKAPGRYRQGAAR